MTTAMIGSDDELLRARDVAARLGVCERLVWRMRTDGTLPAVQIRRAVRFRASDVQRIVDTGAK